MPAEQTPRWEKQGDPMSTATVRFAAWPALEAPLARAPSNLPRSWDQLGANPSPSQLILVYPTPAFSCEAPHAGKDFCTAVRALRQLQRVVRRHADWTHNQSPVTDM